LDVVQAYSLRDFGTDGNASQVRSKFNRFFSRYCVYFKACQNIAINKPGYKLRWGFGLCMALTNAEGATLYETT